MEPTGKTFSLGHFKIQAHRNDIIAISPHELELARSNPEMIIEFSLLCEQPSRFSSCKKVTGSECECECEFCVFEIKHQVQFHVLFFYSRKEENEKYLLATVKTGKGLEPELVPFSVKETSAGWHLKIHPSPETKFFLLPAIWDLKLQSHHSKPPLLRHIVELMVNDAAQGLYKSFEASDNKSSHTFDLIQERMEELCLSRLSSTKGFLTFVVQIGLAALAIRFCGGTSLSNNAYILLDFSVVFTLLGFLFCSCAFLRFGRKPSAVADRITTVIGYITSAFGFIALAGMLMPDNIMLEITGIACIASSLPAIVHAFMNSADYNGDPILPISQT